MNWRVRELPVLFGNQSLPQDTLKADKKSCEKIGPLGMGKRALYLNSFYLSRRYYVIWPEIRRVYKLVAMSKGGFTGIGVFGSMSYLVVELRDGRTKRCQIKYENQVDEALAWIAKHHPEIPTQSEAARKRLQEAEAAEKARYKKNLTPEEKNTVRMLEDAERYLEASPATYANLTFRAGRLRSQQSVGTGRRTAGILLLAGSILLLATGIPLTMSKNPYGLYMVLGGGAFLVYSMASNLVPIGKNSFKRLRAEWEEAVASSEEYISRKDSFPVPARYAHPIVLKRMIRVIREGRAQTAKEALEVVKTDLKALNKSVKVSQAEYDEVIAIKALFLVSDYQ